MKLKAALFALATTLTLSLLATTEKYRLTLRDDPARTIVIGWNQASGSNPVVHFGTTDHGTSWSSYPNSRTPSRVVSYRGMNNHFVRLTGLQPNTNYYFVIRDSQGTSQRLWFRTAPASPSQRLSFIAGGDSRNNRTPRQNANRLVSKLKPHAVLFGGDMTDNDTNTQWQQWFNDWQLTIATDGRMFPIVAARGNHEGSNSTIYNLFDVPSSSVYYALTFGGSLIRTYTLNTETSISGSQTSWLVNDLQSANTDWKMAQYHKPMRPHVGSKSEGNNQYSNWAQPFHNYGMNLVVECDAHTVKTTWPVRPSTGGGSDEGFIRDDNSGTVYVGEGCWGAPLRSNNDSKNWTRNSGSFNQFKWIFVDQSKMEIRTIRVDNAGSVGQNSNSNPFAIPSNLDIWSPSNGSVVTINATNSDPDPGGSQTIERRIATGMDDVEQHTNGSIYTNSSDIELVADGNRGNQTIGLRFTNINIPQGATITRAYLKFTCDETNTGTTNLQIRGEDANDAAPFGTSTNNVSNRSKTSASVAWNPPNWNSVGQSGAGQTSPEIKNVVQEIVNRVGWSTGNDMVFIITGAGERTAESYEGSAGSAPLIHIEYTSEPTDPEPDPDPNPNPDPSGDLVIHDCDNTSGWTSSNSLATNGNSQQGSASVQSIGSGTDDFRRRFASLNGSAAVALEFWYYVSDVSKFESPNQVELGSGDRADQNEYHWSLNVADLNNGWNYISLPLSEARTTNGSPNLSSLNWFRLYRRKNGGVTSRIDYVHLTTDNSTPNPDPDPVPDPDPTPSFVIIDPCDSQNGWGTSGGNTLTVSTNKQEGSGSLQCVGSGTADYRKAFSPKDLTGAVALEFWYYISDVSKFDNSNQVELGSGGRNDLNEYNWSLDRASLSNGWNFISLPFSEAGTTGGTQDIRNINWFRLYRFKNGSVTTRIDEIKVNTGSGSRIASSVQEIVREPTKVYPVPLRRGNDLQVHVADTDEEATIHVRDMAGSVVGGAVVTSDDNRIVRFSTNDYAPGMYIVTVRRLMNAETFKVMVLE